MKRKSSFFVILILGALSTISPFSIDMYLPSFPSIAKDLHSTIADVQLSLTSYFLGISIGQLLYGPLLDRFGRKKPLYVGLLVYIVASIGCAFVESVPVLIGMRLIQALGGCVGLVSSRALVRDIFPVSETARIFSLLMLVVAVSPMFAPTIGGYVSTAFGWHTIFIILAFIGALIIAGCYFSLPEGRKPDPTLSLKPKPILTNFFNVFKHPQFFTFAISGAISSAVTYVYVAGSPDVFMNIYKVSEKFYGWIFAFIGVAIIGSTQLNRLFLKWYKSEQLIFGGLIWQIVVGAFLLVGTIYNWFGLVSMIILIFLFMAGQGFTVPNATALSLAPFARLAGSASALLGALQLGAGALASGLVSFLHNGTALPMTTVMIACSIISLIILQVGSKVISRRISKKELVEEEASELAV